MSRWRNLVRADLWDAQKLHSSAPFAFFSLFFKKKKNSFNNWFLFLFLNIHTSGTQIWLEDYDSDSAVKISYYERYPEPEYINSWKMLHSTILDRSLRCYDAQCDKICLWPAGNWITFQDGIPWKLAPVSPIGPMNHNWVPWPRGENVGGLGGYGAVIYRLPVLISQSPVWRLYADLQKAAQAQSTKMFSSCLLSRVLV